MKKIYKLPLILEPQPEGGYTIICPLLPNLITEADTLEQVLPNVTDALETLLETYQDLNQPLPAFGCKEIPRRSGSSHRKWYNPTNGNIVPIPDWGNKDLKTGTLRHIIRQLGLDWEKFKQV